MSTTYNFHVMIEMDDGTSVTSNVEAYDGADAFERFILKFHIVEAKITRVVIDRRNPT